MSNAAQARMIQMGFMASGRRRSFLLFMKNTRRKRRFENRQNKRKKNFPTESDDFEKIFSHDHLFDAYRKCRQSVGWKPEVQRFTMLAPLEIDRIYKSLHSGNFRSKGFREFDIFERGKPRHIKALPFDERINRGSPLPTECNVVRHSGTFTYLRCGIPHTGATTR